MEKSGLVISNPRILDAGEGGDDDDEETDDEEGQSSGRESVKFIARQGASHQDVIISGPAGSLERLDKLIQATLEGYARAEMEEEEDEDDREEVLGNREKADMWKNEWKEGHREECQRVAQLEADGEHKVSLKKRERTLRGKVGKEEADEYAKRDDAIVSGKARGKHAM